MQGWKECTISFTNLAPLYVLQMQKCVSEPPFERGSAAFPPTGVSVQYIAGDLSSYSLIAKNCATLWAWHDA